MDYSKKVIKKVIKELDRDDRDKAKAIDKRVGSGGISEYRLKQALDRESFEGKDKLSYLKTVKKQQVRFDATQAKEDARASEAKEKAMRDRNLIIARIQSMRQDGRKNVKATAADLNVSNRRDVSVTAYGDKGRAGFANSSTNNTKADRLFQAPSNPFSVTPDNPLIKR